jgi:RNA polymerase sigma-70 factor (ECF subfamily)
LKRFESIPGAVTAKRSQRPSLEDNLWLRQVARGDETALRRLYELRADTLYALALRLLQNPTEAEEALQDAFVRIWRCARTWDEEKAAAFTWMVLIQRRACIDRLRARGRRERLFCAVEDDSGGGEMVFISAEPARTNGDQGTLRDALRRLPPEQREVIELAFYQGLTHSEIAQQRREPLGTIKARLRRAMLRLREFLKDRYD